MTDIFFIQPISREQDELLQTMNLNKTTTTAISSTAKNNQVQLEYL